MKRLLFFISLSFLAVMLIMTAKNEYSRFLPSPGYGMGEIVQQKNIDYLFIGSSTFRRGLDIEVLNKLPGNVYILAYNGCQPVTIEMVLEYLLKQGVTIKHLFVDFYPYTAAARPALSDTRLLMDTDIDFKIDLWQSLHAYKTDSFQAIEDKASDLYEMFISSNNAIILWWPLYQKLIRSKNYRGGIRNLRAEHGQTQETLAQLPMFGKRDGLQKVQIDAYQKIIQTASKHGIQLTYLEIPKYYRLYDDHDYRAFSKQILDSFSNAANYQVISADHIPFDNHQADYFNDLVHLSGVGAHVYTQMLVKTIAPQ